MLSFLEVCISLRYRQLRSYSYRYFNKFSSTELLRFLTIIDKESINEVYLFCDDVSFIEIIPKLDHLKVRELLPNLKDRELLNIFPRLSIEQQIFAFSNLKLEQFWKVLEIMDRNHFSRIVPYISYDHKMSVIDTYFHLQDDVIEFYLENYKPYIIALGCSFVQIKDRIINHSNALTREQIYF